MVFDIAQRPFFQEGGALRVGQSEEKVFGLFHDRRGTGQDGIGVFQFRRGIDAAACLAVVAVLVFCAAFRAFALDVPVRQEHFLDGVEKLFDGSGNDQSFRLETAVDFAGKLVVFGAVGRMPVVEADQKTV